VDLTPPLPGGAEKVGPQSNRACGVPADGLPLEPRHAATREGSGLPVATRTPLLGARTSSLGERVRGGSFASSFSGVANAVREEATHRLAATDGGVHQVLVEVARVTAWFRSPRETD